MYQHLYNQVLDWIPAKSKVLDLGTGDGEFLAKLIQDKQIFGEGVEKNADLVLRCISRGLVVHQGDILDGLDQYGDGTFDYILLLGTFQELPNLQLILREAFRVGKYVVVSYSNFAHLRSRLQVMFSGKTPVTRYLPSPWYSTPNIHFFSIIDFQEFMAKLQIRLLKSAYFNQRGEVKLWSNLLAEMSVSVLTLESGQSLKAEI